MDDEGLRRWSDYERGHGYIRARLRLVSTAEGGRKTPIRSGYRSQWGFEPDVHADVHDAPLLIEETDTLGFGEEAVVRIHPLWPESWPVMRPGLRMTMYEGSRVVGVADVVEVVPPEA